MPYTPPSQQSPASSKTSSPAISRSSSYSEDVPRSPVTGRPQPPRSHSASYLHKHRRSPSFTSQAAEAPPTPTAEGPDAPSEMTDYARSSSVRQSPPPVNNLIIPTGMVISPPDSSENSDGDDPANDQRGRELEKSWDQLKEAVHAINQKREGSPNSAGVPLQETVSEPVSQIVSPTALTPEARKIAHSRSTTETAIVIPRTPTFESPAQTSDDSDEDQGPLSKPSLVRKKSGELVKPALRPSSRRRYSSMPGTPTYSKSVHFNDSDNQTRHFLQVDKPMAVSAGSSPVETYESESEFPFDGEGETVDERDIKLANFPVDTFERRSKPVRVERIFLSPDKQTLIGVCAVQNIHFHKQVVVRFTLDYWKTTSEVGAEFNNDPRSPPTDGCDRFNFHIKLSDQANIDNKTLLLCVRYNVGGQEYWDNNDNTNYQIDFTKTVAAKKPSKPTVTMSPLGARPVSAIPRSRHTPPTSRGRQESVDDDFARLDTSPAYHFGVADKVLGESPVAIKMKPRSKRGSVFTAAPVATNGLGGRYDFGASLSAALSNAQDKLGRQSGLMLPRPGQVKPTESSGSYFGPLDRKEGPAKTDERPDALTTDRPAMGSDQYRDLVQKFCYVGSANRSPPSAKA
ncbi:carbohydrate-binding module family 21 protein [Baudoinia panamericana UAMH 10762]|uniref:Carbohydrate-binding module family 21 protein n=1 Tax=Baudoinia panamericana (strain UAMH 10762) TaxID=717646 RepID=M2MQY6_BAUPA|nr:carbohydrate-binding module family 21 protein [Baudoinia panamericana UAMH 10762]EMC99251.1 carbohydrate-binding module family 21 protein [Baudoinia panamericana UAMH 10762]